MVKFMVIGFIGSLLWLGGVCGEDRSALAQTPPPEEEFVEEGDFLDDRPRDVAHMVIDVDTLQLTPPLVDRPELQPEFEELMWTFFVKADILSLREKYAYDTALIEQMLTFITRHRDATQALTIKLCLARYLAENYEATETARLIGKVVLDDALTLFESIRTQFPDAWQGKYAALCLAYFEREFLHKYDPDTKIAMLRQVFPLAKSLEHDPGFLAYQERFGYEHPDGAAIREAIIELELDRGNIARVEEELALLEQEYPDLTSEILQVRIRINEAYKFKFYGNEIRDHATWLVQLLTTSNDPEEVKRAAAALGNQWNWWKADAVQAPEQQQIHEIVLSYIDRALSGDAAERDAMIDLIYRLWQLAVPALLDTLDHANPERVAFAGDRLLYMRNEEIITAMIEKARAATDDTKKAQLVGLLTRMNEPCVPVMRFRECLPDAQLQELYQRLVVPALEEFQTP